MYNDERNVRPTHDAEQQAPLLSDDGEGQAGRVRDRSSSNASLAHVYRQNSLGERSAWTVQGFALAFVVLIWSLVLSAMPLSLFGFHPMMQSLAFLLLLQAILTLQPTSHAAETEKRLGFRVHRLLNLGIVLPLFTAGASIMWYLHDQPGSAHFISWHGTLGTALIALTWLQVAVGIAATAFDGALMGGRTKAKALWKYHRALGYVLFLVYVLVLYLGAAHTDWSQTNAGSLHHIAVLVCLVGAAAGLVVRVQTSKLPLSRSS